ncbi:MAG: cytochrome c-type biogenesis protein CcmH [Anaerolineales bacterium]|nr:cytochrome c-type biogenesis protein CcmH [Anaerolineales bacterium]
MRRWLLLGLSLGLMALALAPAAAAQENPPTDDQVNAIAKDLYCPVCENVPLDVCPTQACQQWRDTIREKLSAGWTEGQIKQYFVDQYGGRVLATPPATGLNWLVYLLPPLAFAAGAYLLLRAVRGWRAPASTPVPSPAETSANDAYVERLEQELRERS